MSEIAVIHQPDFLPHIGFFDRLLDCDIFVVLDTAQFVRGSKESWQYRDKIKTPAGAQWITIGVEKCPLGTAIRDVHLLNSRDWRDRIMNLISQNYREAAYYRSILPTVEQIIYYENLNMAAYNWHSIECLMKLFKIEVEVVWNSALGVEGKSNQLLVNILERIGVKQYLSGVGARGYFDPLLFEAHNISVRWQEFKHPVYPQLHGSFVPFLSSIDILFNVGADEGARIIRDRK